MRRPGHLIRGRVTPLHPCPDVPEVTDTRHDGDKSPRTHPSEIQGRSGTAAWQTAGMSTDKRPLPDEDVKRKFREALERKQRGAGMDVSDHSEHGKVEHAHGPEGNQKMFRRRSGGS